MFKDRGGYSPRLRPCPVIRNTSKEHASAANLLWICKPTLPHKAKDSVLGIVSHAVAGVEQVGQEAMRAVLRAFEIEHVKLAARFEDAPHRTSVLPFSSGGRWWNMNDENTRSNHASGYGSSSPNP